MWLEAVIYKTSIAYAKQSKLSSVAKIPAKINEFGNLVKRLLNSGIKLLALSLY